MGASISGSNRTRAAVGILIFPQEFDVAVLINERCRRPWSDEFTRRQKSTLPWGRHIYWNPRRSTTHVGSRSALPGTTHAPAMRLPRKRVWLRRPIRGPREI
jgi:hypothetical protein